MTDLKDRLPATATAKPENQVSQAAPVRPAPSLPRVVPPSAGGMGHAMMAPVRAAAAPAPNPQIAPPQIASKVAVAPPVTAKPISQPAPMSAPLPKSAMPEIVIKAINSTAPWEGYRKFAVASGIEAAAEAGAIWIRGLERLQDELAAMALAQMAASGAAAKELAACATFEDLMTTQVLLTRANFDRFSAATAKISQISVTVAKDSLAPISEGLVASTDHLIESLNH